MPGSRPPLGDHPVVCASGCRTQAKRSVRPQTTPPRSPSRAPVPRWGITFVPGVISAISARVYPGYYLLPSMPSTSARVYHGNAGWRSLPAIRKALGAVEGCSRGLMTGVSPALPETKARNGAQPLATRTNYKYHPAKLTKKIQTKKSNK